MTSKNTPPGAVDLGIWGNIGVWVAFGCLFGVVVGVFFDNIALGAASGTALGAAFGSVFIARKNDHGES